MYINWSNAAVKSFAVFVVLTICATVVHFAQHGNTGNDPRPTLFVSESILDRGTIKLDHYDRATIDWIGYSIKGHYYDFFPIGTALFSLPVVAVYHVLGLTMVDHQAEAQIVIATMTSVLTLYFLFRLANLFLGHFTSITMATTFWFGSSLASTCGTALWSHDFATLFAVLALYITLITVINNRYNYSELIAVLLFSSYLCRPTMLLFTIFIVLFIATYNKNASIRVLLLFVTFFGAFIVFNIHEYGEYLPPYFMPRRLSGGNFYLALYGNLLSPARGILIYSPFILVSWLCIGCGTNKLGLKSSWLLVGLAWPVAHLLLISQFPQWWAGSSYGARLMTDVIPGLFLLTVRTWPTTIGGRGDATKVGILAAATIFAIYVNSYQGLFNVYTALWNGEPNIDLHPEYLFDWRYPQFLNNERRQKERADESRAAADAVAAKLRSLQNLATTGTLKVSELSNDTLPISSITPTQFGAPAAILTALYNATFGRPPDRPTLSFYLAYATTHPVTPLTQYALWFLTSPEYTGLPAHRYAESITGNSRFIADSLFNLLHQSVAVSDIAAYQTIFVNPLLRGLEPGTDSYQAAELQARAQFLVFLSLILQRDEELPKSPLN